MSALALQVGLSIMGAIRLFGSSTCPSPQEVEAELAKSSPNPKGEVAAVRLERDAVNGTLRLLLYDANGVPQGTRTLPATGDCRELATATATLLRSLDLELEIAPPPLPIVTLEAPGAERDSSNLEIGTGGLGSLTSDGSGAAGLLVLGSIALPGWALQPVIDLQIETARHLTVGTGGQATWWRVWAAPGIEWRLLRRPFFWLSLQGSVPLGASLAAGNGYPLDQAGAAFELGLSAGIRFGLRPRSRVGRPPSPSLLPWAGAWIIAWPIPHALSVSGESGRAGLPQLEAALGLGLSWSER